MTIKQLGGVFGRNPTFNDVEIDNDLTVDNNLIVNNRIGVETSAPDESVHLYEPSGGDLALKIQSNPSFAYSSTRIKMKAGNLGVNEIYFGDASSDDIAKIRYEHSTNAMAFKVNNQEALRINSTGNLVVLSGNGIDFSATSGTGTSELFNDYEEGTFTCTDASGGGNAIVTNYASYTKIGNAVTISLYITVPAGATGSGALLGGLPFAPATNNNVMVAQNTGGLDIIAKTNTSSFLVIYPSGSGSASTWLSLASDDVYITGTYYV